MNQNINKANKLLQKAGFTIDGDIFKWRRVEIPLSDFFKPNRANTRRIPKTEEELREILKNIKVRFTRTGSIFYNNKFYSMEWFRNILNLIPVERRAIPLRFHEDLNMGIRTYFVNNFNEETSNNGKIVDTISSRLEHAKLSGYTNKSDVSIRFIYDNEGYYSTKSFNTFELGKLKSFKTALRNYVENTTSSNVNYTYNIKTIIIKIIKENSGGCNTGSRDKIVDSGGVKFKDIRADNNNCLFKCLEESNTVNLYPPSKGRVLGKLRNKIRSKFNIPDNEPIPISVALKIFDKYKINKDSILVITDAETYEEHSTKSQSQTTVIHLQLKDGHYTLKVDTEPNKKCPDCLKSYVKKHTCNSNRRSFVNNKILKNNKRSLICSSKEEKENTKDYVIHYDLETFRTKVGDNEIHTTYIVGYNIGSEFHYMAGDNCISDFLDYLLLRVGFLKKTYGTKKKLFVNAFNGANFDHYEIRKEFLKRGITPDKEIINNGSIIKFEYNGIHLFDVCKHLTGSLQANLKEFGCAIQKGDFDHEKASRWEDMSSVLREKCLLYLKSDVMGLKEIYDKLNTEIFDKYKYNLTSFISTSSLSFNLWKENINGKHYINLPTLEEEKMYRKAVRGGRTYKSKNRFISEQYQQFLTGKLSFNEIDDYLIDADVVSLYPTAMAKFEYPVGDSTKLDMNDMNFFQNEKHSNYYKIVEKTKQKMGIYEINYISNKNLQHSIGGRRDEDGALKWDLKDSTGYYTSVDIEDMLDNGYKVEVLGGYYWTQTAYIFTDFINDLFEKKKNSKKGSVSYALAKLFMNSLYGKMIQRPIYVNTETISTNAQYWKFWRLNTITDIERLGTDWVVSGVSKEEITKEKSITKPTHLGAFILAYSRRIMLGYIKESNPNFENSSETSTDFFYTDTDSIQTHVSNAKLIKNLGNKDLGGITDDLGDGCKIIKGIWIAPKLYMLEYVRKDTGTEIHHHFRGKGLNKNALNVEVFEKMDTGGELTHTRNFQMKKIHIKRNSKQRDIPQFSIVHYSKENVLHKNRLTKTVNKKAWEGRKFIDINNSQPWV